jgi:molybdenum cofactor cytidylyltransferase
MKSIYYQIVTELQLGLDFQTGTLVFTKGSAPQIPGATAIFNKDEVLSGTLGGGMLEIQAQKAAALASFDGIDILQWVHFNAEMDDQTGAICGGSGLFFIDANPKRHLDTYLKLVDSIDKLKCGVLITIFRNEMDQKLNIERFWVESKTRIPENIEKLLRSEQVYIDQIIESRNPCWIQSLSTSGINPVEQFSIFIEPIYPIPKLLIVGAGHIGRALSKVASSVDFEITVLDSRPEMATDLRFPDANQIICKSIAEGFQSIKIRPDTYILIATQDHRNDTEALKCCICSDAAYIGVIGSKRKTILMKGKFIEECWASPEEWSFVHTPVGLDIHSKSVNEIALSIAAELIKERYEINFLRKRKKVCCLVLAAGKSSRMGQQKLLLPFDNKSMIKTVVEKSINSNADQTIVVIGSHNKELTRELAEYSLLLVENTRFEEGMLSSVQVGFAAIQPDSDAAIVLLGDQPMVSEEVINRLISVFQKTAKGLIIPTFNGKRGHPVLISSKYQESIQLLNPEIGLRDLFLKNSQDILEIEVQSDNVLKDIDTPEDYQRESNSTNKN